MLLVCGAAGHAVAAPPPPPVYPDDLPPMLDGYDLRVYYSRYSYWLEGQKGKAIEQIMGEVPAEPGYRAAYGPVASFRLFGDYGHFMSGELRGFCRAVDEWRLDTKDCHFLFRKITIPARLLDRDGPLGSYMRRSFDPVVLVAGLKVEKTGTDADVWRIDGDKAFAALGSPRAVLIANARVDQVDSRECPAMLAELEKLDQAQLAYRTDLPLVGEDALFEPPAPHSVMREDKMNFRTQTGIVAVTAGQNDLYDFLAPLYAAIEACQVQSDQKAGN